MNANLDKELSLVQDELKIILLKWAAQNTVDEQHAKKLRRKAAAINFLRYRDSIPYFKRVCEMTGINGDEPSFESIVENLLITDDVFKSYPQSLLDDKDFPAMTRWLANISAVDVSGKADSAKDLDQWVDQLSKDGMHLVFSSGTSGSMSFVPRDEATWDSFIKMPLMYLPFLMADLGIVGPVKAALLKFLGRNFSPDTLLDLFSRFGLRDFDGYFCNFSGGAQGIQLVGQEIGKFCGSATFLYDQKMSATAVRGIVRGAKTLEEHALIQEFLKTTVHDKDANYARLLRGMKKSARKRRKVILFGTPYLLLEICRKMQAMNMKLKLRKGSAVVFGGGWKSFDGSRIPEDELVSLIGEMFGIDPGAVSEGYSMTEIQGLMLRCKNRRYHVPPHLETVILDEELKPMEGDDVTGVLGVIDPFASSYPGFLITGDSVRRISTPCPCGRKGDQIIAIERSPGREVKGCGGIMAKVNA